ncbi:hypothetical protein EJB05_44616, partial [Eragrostis curvula]
MDDLSLMQLGLVFRVFLCGVVVMAFVLAGFLPGGYYEGVVTAGVCQQRSSSSDTAFPSSGRSLIADPHVLWRKGHSVRSGDAHSRCTTGLSSTSQVGAGLEALSRLRRGCLTAPCRLHRLVPFVDGGVFLKNSVVDLDHGGSCLPASEDVAALELASWFLLPNCQEDLN